MGAPAAGAGGAAPAAEAPAEEKKEEEKEESDEDMVRYVLCNVCHVLTYTYAYVITNRALVSSTDLWALVLTCIVFSLHSPSPCISPLHNAHKIIALLPWCGVHPRSFR